MSTEIALSDQMKKAEVMAASSLLPESYRKQPANLLWAMELADALDVSLAQAINGISVIKGKPTMSAEMMRALVMRAGHRFAVTEFTDESVTVTVARKEWPEDVQQFTFTMADAKHAGLANSDTYRKHPKAMLLARATSAACRAVFPDVVSGMGYTPDEIAGSDPVKRADTSKFAPNPTLERVETAAEVAEVDTETGEILTENDPEDAILDAETVDDEPLSRQQSARISAAIKVLELSKDDGLALYEEVTGRAVSATSELTSAEAEQVLSHLEVLTSG